jgi:hypothetical protein
LNSSVGGRGVVPFLLDDAAEAVESRVLVAAVAGPRADVRQIDVGLGMGALDDRPQPEVAVPFQSSRVVRERRETADREDHESRLIRNVPNIQL